MKGYVGQRRGRYYEGRDPVTGKERRTWHPAGTDRVEAERPAKKLHLATSTYRAYERNVQLNILPTKADPRKKKTSTKATNSQKAAKPARKTPVERRGNNRRNTP